MQQNITDLVLVLKKKKTKKKLKRKRTVIINTSLAHSSIQSWLLLAIALEIE